MVDDALADGERIARLLSSEIHGHERGALRALAVADVEEDVEPSEAGRYAYAVEFADESDDKADDADDDRRVASVYVHPDRCHIEFQAGVEVAADAGQREGLRVRPKATTPPRTLVFVESGAEVKAALRVVRAVGEALDDAG